MTTRILLLAGDTDHNIGDLAIATAIIEELRRLDFGLEISMVTSRADRDAKRLKIRPIRRGPLGLLALARAARQADLVICGGGGLFQDDDSLVKMPYWALRLLFVRLLTRRIAGLSIGAGPLNFATSRFFARLALRTMSPVSVRDELARQVLQPLTAKCVDVVPDPAFMLSGSSSTRGLDILRSNGVPVGESPVIGIAARRCFHTDSNWVPHKYLHALGVGQGRGRQPMIKLMDRIASALDSAVRQSGAYVVFLPTYMAHHEDDRLVSEQIRQRMKTAPGTIVEIADPADYMSVVGQLSVMLCGRMHAAIMAASAGTPVVGLAYNQKFSGTFSQLGLTDCCMSVEDLINNDRQDDLADLLLRLAAESSHMRPRPDALRERTRRYVEHLTVTATLAESPAAPQESGSR